MTMRIVVRPRSWQCLPGAGLGGAVMLAAAATAIVYGEYVRAAPPVVVPILLAVVARAAL
jgi:hypothetical protein